jgi:hypothetical protein
VDRIRLHGVRGHFAGFDRSPYLASFQLKGLPLSVQLVNVHLFYGSEARKDIERRALETAAVAKWTDLRHRSVPGRPGPWATSTCPSPSVTAATSFTTR